MERNPSPPAVCGSEVGDNIGNTAFSQRFVLGALLSVLKETSSCETETEEIAELDGDLEHTLCQLWDMSTDSEIGSFLLDSDAYSLFSAAISVTNKPRLVEILVGILANVACDSKHLDRLVAIEEFAEFCFMLLRYRDTPTLVETSRLILLVLQGEKWTSQWNDKFQEMDVWPDIRFMAESTTSDKLLCNVAQIIDILIDLGQADLTNRLISDPPASWKCLLDGLEEATKSENLPALAPFCHCLQSMTLTEGSANALLSDGAHITEAVGQCLDMVTKLEESSELALNVVLSSVLLLRTLLNSEQECPQLPQVKMFLESAIAQSNGDDLKYFAMKCLDHLNQLCQT